MPVFGPASPAVWPSWSSSGRNGEPGFICCKKPSAHCTMGPVTRASPQRLHRRTHRRDRLRRMVCRLASLAAAGGATTLHRYRPSAADATQLMRYAFGTGPSRYRSRRSRMAGRCRCAGHRRRTGRTPPVAILRKNTRGSGSASVVPRLLPDLCRVADRGRAPRVGPRPPAPLWTVRVRLAAAAAGLRVLWREGSPRAGIDGCG
jgi:hypothetical protein